MDSTIRELYYGTNAPFHASKDRGARYKEHAVAADKAEKEITKNLNEELRPLLEEYRENLAELNGISIEDAFAEGYRIGSLLMLEVLIGKERK